MTTADVRLLAGAHVPRAATDTERVVFERHLARHHQHIPCGDPIRR